MLQAMMRQMESQMTAAFDEVKKNVRQEREGADKKHIVEERTRSPRTPASKVLDELD
jgi:hypothetical protein